MTNSSRFEFPRPIAIVPAFNESASIAKVVKGIRLYLPILVVDDGSADMTGEIACSEGATVSRHQENKGYEAALSTGLREAYERGFTHAITLDADGQHEPDAIRLFLTEIEAGADLVLSRRDRLPRISEKCFALVASYLWGIHDPLSGMKAYRLSLLDKFGPFDKHLSVGTEFAIRLVRNDISFSEIPLNIKPRINKPRFGGTIVANYRIFRALFLVLIHR